MTLMQLLDTAQIVVDKTGEKKAVLLEWAVWKDILALLEAHKPDLETELAAWDTLSDEALLNFETELESV